jgi:pullulanase
MTVAPESLAPRRSAHPLAPAIRRLIPVLLALLALLTLLPLARAAQAADDHPRLAPKLRLDGFSVNGQSAESLLVIHYHRPGRDYTGWNIWYWPEGRDGQQANLGGEDAFGRYAIIPFAPSPARAGFIIRKGNWEEKDFDQDRFVPLAKGSITEIWVKSGEDAYTTDPGAIDTSVRVVGAFLDRDDVITLALSAPWNDPKPKDIDVANTRAGGRATKVKSVKSAGTSGGKALYEIALAREVDDADIASLRLDWTGGPLADAPPVRVLARDVLDGPAFTASDARLGAFVSNGATTFVTWSPVSETVELLVYEGNAPEPTRTIPLARGAKGVWSTTVAQDLHGAPYRYRFHAYGERREAPDMHAFAANADSSRSVVVDLDRVKPDGFDTTPEPKLARPTDEILYEIHVRDYSQRDPRVDDDARGTYLGLVHAAPETTDAPSSGLDHLRELGITAVHLLPIHDYTAKVGEYNWGYWTTLFNVPESNYATDPSDPFSAIRDLRTAVTRLHAADIRVILDVVYNHTSDAGPSSPFGAAVPGYFFRTTRDGRLMNDSGTGNALADERPMVRKYILDSLEHWLRQYRVDGFRFDLLGCHRPETVRAACERVKSIRPDATLYGEPWTGGGPIHFGKGAQKGLPIAVFNDHLRNAIRGDLDGTTVGFATGEGGDAAAIRRGVAGAIDDFTREPTETINYASAHDNLILWDKIAKTAPGASDATRRAMQKLALGVVLTSQGIPFIHGGCDFARTKQGNHNSYDAGDGINDFGWSRKSEYRDIFDFTAGLVRLRREHPAFRMDDDADVRKALTFAGSDRPIVFMLDGRVAKDPWSRILVAYNDEPSPAEVTLPAGDWTVVVDAERAGTEPLRKARGRITLPGYSMLVAHRD